jgi:hypothetical protein
LTLLAELRLTSRVHTIGQRTARISPVRYEAEDFRNAVRVASQAQNRWGEQADMLSPSFALILVTLLPPPMCVQSTFQPPTACGPVVTLPTHGIPEVHRRSADLSVWALFFDPPMNPVRFTHTDIKIV